MPLKGVIDLGSNTIRLVVYDVKLPHKGDFPSQKGGSAKQLEPVGASKLFRSILDEKKVAGLSAYVVNGQFTKEGIDRAIDCLKELLDAAENIGCKDVQIFATAVIRNCTNSKEAVSAIGKAIKGKIDLLSSIDEAHLGFVGATCDSSVDEGALIDIGGGSTELTAIHGAKDTHDLSLPQGSVSSYASFVKMILPTPEEISQIEAAFKEKLSSVTDIDDYKAQRLYGIGGSVRAIDKLYATAFANDRRLRTLEKHQIEALFHLLESQPSTFAHAATKAVPDRLHTVVPGMAILRCLLEALDASSITICKYGIREGYLLERILGV